MRSGFTTTESGWQTLWQCWEAPASPRPLTWARTVFLSAPVSKQEKLCDTRLHPQHDAHGCFSQLACHTCRSPSLLRHQGAKKNSTQSETPEEEVPTGTTSSTSLAHANQQPITASTDCWMTSLLPHKQRGQIYLAARGIPPPSSGEQPPLAVFTAVEAKPRVFCSVCVGSRRQCLWRCLRFRQQPGLLGESRLCGPPAG